MQNKTLFTAAVLGLAASYVQAGEKSETKKPNIIYILADDLGYGDLGCFGQKKFQTPNIDHLAQQGMRFTQHYAGCTVSAPSRSVLLTGLHTGHTYIRGNREMKDRDGQAPINAEAYTIAEMFKANGYATGAFGKWGLGYVGSEGDPNKQGFDEFFGYNCQRQAHRYYPQYLWHNEKKVMLKGNDTKHKVTFAPDVIHEKALEFIREHKDKPFFAYIPIIQPHAELLAPNDDLFKKYDGKYVEKPYVAPKKGAEYGSPDYDVMEYCSQEKPHATFAAMVSRVDKYVGDIMNLLKDLNLDENTIVIFTSDNGPHIEGGADPEFFNSNADYRGHKRNLTDGGIRVPMIAYWKNKIKAGTTSDFVSAFWDMMPTFADAIDAKAPKNIDGFSILPTMLGKRQVKTHDFLYWEYQGGVAVRMGDWKAIRLGVNKNENAKVQLYNVVKDSEELNDVASQHPDLVKKALKIMKREHISNDNFPLYKSEYDKK